MAIGYGIDPVHLGIVFLANMQIGYFTPPVGMKLFIASHRFGRPVLALCRATLPFFFVLLGVFNFKDAQGKNVPYQEVLQRTAENNTLPDFAYWMDRVHFGTLSAVSVSEREQGLAAGRLARAPEEVVENSLAGVRVLVVENNPTNRSILVEHAIEWEMHTASAANGAEALQLLRRAAAAGVPFQVALIDMKMPVMDGLELARAVKADAAIAHRWGIPEAIRGGMPIACPRLIMDIAFENERIYVGPRGSVLFFARANSRRLRCYIDRELLIAHEAHKHCMRAYDQNKDAIQEAAKRLIVANMLAPDGNVLLSAAASDRRARIPVAAI